jgi:hypothetical protein
MYQVREMTQSLSKTHYVFSHSTSSYFFPLYLFYTKLYACFQAAEKVDDFVLLKSPFEILNPVERSRPRQAGDATRDPLRLISADVFHASTEERESALDMSRYNRWSRGIDATSVVIKYFMNELQNWNIDPAMQSVFRDRLLIIYQRPLQNKPEGRASLFYGIAVPKDKTFEVGYFVHRMGYICDCYQSDPHLALQQLQEGRRSACQGPWGAGRVPQFRLYPEMLKPENGVITRVFSDFTPGEQAWLRAETRALAQDVFKSIKGS